MAQIFHSDLAPAGKVHYSLANVEFDIDGDTPFETTDSQVLASASTHPWLKVVHTVEEVAKPVFVDHLAPEDDVLSAKYKHKHEDVKNEVKPVAAPVAIESGKDQDDSKAVIKTTPPTAETLAAADTTSKRKN